MSQGRAYEPGADAVDIGNRKAMRPHHEAVWSLTRFEFEGLFRGGFLGFGGVFPIRFKTSSRRRSASGLGSFSSGG
jgi:hypothetical protein